MKIRNMRSSSAPGTFRPLAIKARSIMRRATADHSPRVIVGDRRQAFAGENEIERRNQIGRGIDQRAVEIEDDGAHASVLIPVFARFESKTTFAALGSPP